MNPKGGGGGRGMDSQKSEGDAPHLTLGCKLQILVSIRVFRTESHHICPFSYQLGLYVKIFLKNAVSVLVWTPLGVSFSLSHTYIDLPSRFNNNVF